MKTVEEIYQELLSAFAERAGWTPDDDCELSIRLYAAAAQLQALSIQADWVLAQSFPQTAEGEYLDYHAQLRGITRSAAQKAVGLLQFSVASASAADLTVESGTVCMTENGIRFETTQSVTLSAGQLSVTASAAAVEAGTAGNAVAGAISLMTVCPIGITAVTNSTAFSGGTDAEDDESLRARILSSYRRLPNGANAAWYEETAMAHSGIAAAKAVGRARGIGTVDVYVTTPAGIPGAELLAAVQSDLAAKREIAVDVQAKAPTAQSVNMTASIAVEDGYVFSTVKSSVESAVTSLFTGKLLGKPMRMAELSSLIYDVEGVQNCHLSAPSADLAASDTVLPVLGTLTISEMEA